MSGELSHLDRQGRAMMVDVSAKGETERTATARARIVMLAETLSKLADGTAPKGDVLAAARIAGIMAAKRTAELIPLCHPLALTSVAVELVANAAGPAVDIAATVKTKGPTGVEMEALTAAAVAALTIYDMLKSADRGMRIEGLRLTHKAGGKSGEFQAP